MNTKSKAAICIGALVAASGFGYTGMKVLEDEKEMQKAEKVTLTELKKQLDGLETGKKVLVRVDGIVKCVEKSLVNSGIGEENALIASNGDVDVNEAGITCSKCPDHAAVIFKREIHRDYNEKSKSTYPGVEPTIRRKTKKVDEDIELCPFYVEDDNGDRLIVDPTGASLKLQFYKEQVVDSSVVKPMLIKRKTYSASTGAVEFIGHRSYEQILCVDGCVSVIGYASKRSDGQIVIESSPELESSEDAFKVFAITNGITLEDIEAEKRARGLVFLEVGAGFGVAALGMLGWMVAGALKRAK